VRPGGTTPATVAANNVDSVKGVSVITGSYGSLEWLVSLPQPVRCTMSISKTPSDFVLGIG